MTEENLFFTPDSDEAVLAPVPETGSPEEEASSLSAELTPLIPGTEIIGRSARRAAMMMAESEAQISLWESAAELSSEDGFQGSSAELSTEAELPSETTPVLEAEPVLEEKPSLEEVPASEAERALEVESVCVPSSDLEEEPVLSEKNSSSEKETVLPAGISPEPEPPSMRLAADVILAEEDDYAPVDQIPHRRRRTAEEVPPRPVKKNGSAVSPFVEFVEIVVGALVAAILVLTLICRTGVVEGDSMVPTMYSGDRYVISDLFYTPEQGDIVVFRPGVEGEDELWIKRVIALEGQTVYIDPNSYQVYVDGKLLDEPYLGGAGTIPHTTENPITVPEGCVYVLGDNRAISHDSRYEDLGCVEVGQLAGRVILRFWPLEDFGFCE